MSTPITVEPVTVETFPGIDGFVVVRNFWDTDKCARYLAVCEELLNPKDGASEHSYGVADGPPESQVNQRHQFGPVPRWAVDEVRRLVSKTVKEEADRRFFECGEEPETDTTAGERSLDLVLHAFSDRLEGRDVVHGVNREESEREAKRRKISDSGAPDQDQDQAPTGKDPKDADQRPEKNHQDKPHTLLRSPLVDAFILNKYRKGEGIRAHVDLLHFEEGVVGFSLKAAGTMAVRRIPKEKLPVKSGEECCVFGRDVDAPPVDVAAAAAADQGEKMRKTTETDKGDPEAQPQPPPPPATLVPLQPGDAYLIAGPARYEFTHAILPVEEERVSLTLRKLKMKTEPP